MQQLHVCIRCGSKWLQSELKPIKGEPVGKGKQPSGECPDTDCEAFCFPDQELFETCCLVAPTEQVMPRPIVAEKMPESNTGAEATAKGIIDMLDKCDMTKEQVYAVAVWVRFMATQS